MAQQQFDAMRGRLQAERDRLQGDIAALDAEDQQPSGRRGHCDHIADDATDVMNRERNAALRKRQRSARAGRCPLERIDRHLRHL